MEATDRSEAVSDILSGYGARIRTARMGAGIRTQAEFARALGIDSARVNQWEKEKHPPKLDMLILLGTRFGIGSDWILWGDIHGLSARILQGVIGLANDQGGDPVAREVREALRYESERDLALKMLAEPPRTPIFRYVRPRPD